MGDSRRLENGGDGSLQLEEQDAAFLEFFLAGVYIGFGEVSVGTRSHHYAVFCMLVNGDEGNAGRLVGAENSAHVKAFLFVLRY